jgi:hypothetical protein
MSASASGEGVMAVRDPDTRWVRVQTYGRMTPAEQLDIATRMYEDAVALIWPSILDRNPGTAVTDHEPRAPN